MPTKTFQQKSKKVKVGTILNEDILRRLKERAAKEGRTISALIEEAVLKHEQEEAYAGEMRLRALESVFSVKFNISRKDLDEIMDEDFYDQ